LLRVEWRGAEATHKGYGHFGTSVRDALANEGVEIVGPGKANFVLACTTPTQVSPWYDGQKLALSTMWETDNLPPAFIEPLASYDYLVVPNYHNQRIFRQHGYDTQVACLGISPEEYYFKPKVTKRNKPFMFLIVGGKKRKGIDLAVDAFRQNFLGTNAELVIKDVISPVYGTRQIRNVSSRLSVQEMRELYWRADCVLAPSRGEGWGLPPLEAMACGTPTIVADNTGLSEFAHMGIPISCDRVQCKEYFLYGDAGYWHEPRFDELVEKMKWVFHNRDKANGAAEKAASLVAKKFTWKQTAKRLIELYGYEMERPAKINPTKIKHPKIKKYTVTMKKDWLGIKICGTPQDYHAGQSYPVTLDVMSMMENQGLI